MSNSSTRQHQHARRTLSRAGAAIMLTAGLLVGSTAPARAHNALLSTKPADGATLSAMPATVVLHFAEPAQRLGTVVVVLGPAGNVATGRPAFTGSDLRQPVAAGSPTGTYTVNWRVVSDDGHPVQGSFRFTTTSSSPVGPPSTTAAASATPTEPVTMASAGTAPAVPSGTASAEAPSTAPTTVAGGTSWQPAVIGGLATLLVIVVGALVVSRRRRPPTGR